MNAMSWQEFSAARQHLAEERVGRLSRMADNTEDEAIAASTAALRRDAT